MKLYRWGLLINILAGIFLLHILFSLNKFDSTDDIKNKKHSGLILYTDHATGCQYLKGGLFGAIYPRLDSEGYQICQSVTFDGKDK